MAALKEVFTVAKRSNGEGTIKKRSDGRWEGQYTIDFKRRSIYGKTQEEVRKKLNQVINEIESGLYTDNTITVGAWLNTWLYEYKKGSVKQKTFQGHETMVRCHLLPAFNKIKLKDLTVDHVQRLLNAKTKEGLSNRTVRYIRSTLQNALGQAIQNGLIIRNIAQAVKVGEGKQKERRILTPQEQQALVKALAGERRGFMVYFALYTGLRRGELLGVRWSDVDMNANTLTVCQNVQRLNVDDGKSRLVIDTPKTKKSNRTITMLPEVTDKLREHFTAQSRERILAGQLWHDNDLIFCTELGKPIEPRNLQRFINRVTDKIGIPHVNTHALRHAFATRALEQGVTLKAVSEMLGHSSIQMTADIYSHLSLEHMETEMQKMRAIA
jgi:integrase